MSATRAGRALVSVITPCYNAREWLPEAIRSVAGQTYGAVEHIAVDDGSADGTWELLSAFPAVRRLRLERNFGGAFARNRGFELARGDFVMFLDADDTLAPETLGALSDALGGGADVTACRWRRLRRTAFGWKQTEPDTLPPPAGADVLARWLEGDWIPPCALLWTRRAYERTGGWDERLLANQDGDLVLRALGMGMHLAPASAGIAFYRDHGRGSSVGSDHTDVRKLESRLRVLEKLTATLAAAGTLPHYRRPLGIAYHRLGLLALAASPELSRLCRERGRAYAGAVDVSRTRAGRVLGRIVGLERKEWVADRLAQLGIATRARRRMLARRRFEQDAAAAADPARAGRPE